ncbi:MAG: hypothetical protein RL417_625, partial [Pseudomonadota bacterium]
KSLIKSNPKFVVLGSSSGGNGIDVKRLDTNELLSQLGAFEALAPKTPPGEKAGERVAAPAP